MRIRRRPPPPPPPPPPPIAPDPPPHLLQPLLANGSRDEEETSHGDLPQRSSNHPPLSHPNGCNPIPLQGSEELELELDANKMWGAQVNTSNYKRSTAFVSNSIVGWAGGEEVDPLKKGTGGCDDGDGGERPDEGPVDEESMAKANAGASSGEKRSDESVVKKRRRPAVLMEGSRCSRVNGRGWRCGQQTLVGYSLCEHHLGKGKLRSVSGTRGRLGTSRPIGMAKARSMSSLLDEAADQSVASVLSEAAAAEAPGETVQ